MHHFTLVALNQHLDKGTCQPGDPEPSLKERGLPTVQGSNPSTAAGGSSWFQRSNMPSNHILSNKQSQSPLQQARKRLARPNYSFVKEAEIRKMLEEYRLATAGSKERLIERHRQWVTLYNANLDASERIRKSDVGLRKDLAEWERGQDDGQKKAKAKAKAMTEEKAKAWEQANSNHFKDLERKARESYLKSKEAAAQRQDQDEGGNEEEAAAAARQASSGSNSSST